SWEVQKDILTRQKAILEGTLAIKEETLTKMEALLADPAPAEIQELLTNAKRDVADNENAKYNLDFRLTAIGNEVEILDSLIEVENEVIADYDEVAGKLKTESDKLPGDDGLIKKLENAIADTVDSYDVMVKALSD